MLETMLSFLLVEHLWGAVINQPELGLGYPRMLTPHRRPYATKDGYIAVIAVSDAHWGRLFEAMGKAALIEDPRFATIAARSDNVDALYGVLAEGMHERTTAEWLSILGALDIPCGPVNTLDGPAAGRVPARDRVLPADAASARSASHSPGDTGPVLRQPTIRTHALARARPAHRRGVARDRLRRAGDPVDRCRLTPTASGLLLRAGELSSDRSHHVVPRSGGLLPEQPRARIPRRVRRDRAASASRARAAA